MAKCDFCRHEGSEGFGESCCRLSVECIDGDHFDPEDDF